MANQITDNRTSLTTNDTTANIVDATGAATGNQNTETYIQGNASTSGKASSATIAMLYDASSAQNWSNNTFYIWWNCTTAGKLNTKSSGGVRMRFCGAVVTDFFEVYIDGSDTYSGGFKMTVIDIERASSNPSNTGGTPPATSAIRYVGIIYDVTSMISGNVDNCFLDAMWRLPASTPGIIVEGQNGGSSPWTWQDIVNAADVGDTTKAWGTAFNRDGVIFINTPIRFGANDSTTHNFSDSNAKVQWENQLVALTGFYNLEIIGGSGSQSFQLGTKTGSGDDATGALGGSIGAAGAGSRWSFDASDSNVDACYLYGVIMDHAESFQIDNSNVEIISSAFIDCTSALVSNSLFLRNKVVNANTADGESFLTTDDLGDVRFSEFQFSDGHAILLTTPRVATQTSKGNKFTNYGADDTSDSTVLNSTGGQVDINVTNSGDSPTVNPTSSTSVSNPITHTVTGLNSGSQVIWIRQSDEVELENKTESSGSASYAYNYAGDVDVWVQILSISKKERLIDVTLGNTDQTLPAGQEDDPFYSNPQDLIMAKIVDPDQLNQGTEVDYTTSTKQVALNIAGNLDDNSPGKSSGVAHQALYSHAKEEWLTDATLQPVRFPFLPIFEAKFDWINDWQPADQQTRDLIRDGGFRVVILNDEYACIISLQSFNDSGSDLAYYWQTAGWTSTTASFDKTGELNEPILIYDGSTDYRDFLKVALRVQGKTYGYGNLIVDQDLSAITYQAYRIPISNALDPNINETDGNIDTNAPYTNMELSYLKGNTFETWANSTTYSAGAVVLDAIRQSNGSSNGTWWFTPGGGTTSGTGTADDTGITDWESYVGQEQIGTEWYAFNRIIDLTSGTGTRFQIYEWGMRQLRKSGDINSDALGAPNQDAFGTVNGEVAMGLFDFVGSDLVTRAGVLVRDFDTNDTNNIKFNDITVDGGGLDQDNVPLTSTERTFPFVAAGTLVFSDNLVNEPDVDTVYKMFFQYTTRDTGTDIAVTSSSGATATLTSSTTDFTTNFTNGDYIEIDGFTATEDNGIFQVNGAVTANSMPVRKVNGETLSDEAAGNSINLDADPYDSPDAVVVNDNSATPITGQITAKSIAFDFDYDNNNQGGRSAGTDAPVAVIAQGKDGSQWVDGLFTITRNTGLSFPLNANDDLVYNNPQVT